MEEFDTKTGILARRLLTDSKNKCIFNVSTYTFVNYGKYHMHRKLRRKKEAMQNFLKIHPKDKVAVALKMLPAGECRRGGDNA